MPFAGSMSGSDHGHMITMPMAYQNTGSMYGMPPMMSPRDEYEHEYEHVWRWNESRLGHRLAAVPPSVPPLGLGSGQRPMSTFSMATSVGLFGPSNSTNPSDEEIIQCSAELSQHAGPHDSYQKVCAILVWIVLPLLIIQTCRTAREAIAAKFPKADLTTRKDFLNQSIDRILSES
jgi:chitin synthase